MKLRFSLLALVISACSQSDEVAAPDVQEEVTQEVFEVVAETAQDLVPEATAFVEKPEHVVFDWNADPVAIPFPSDHHRDPVDGHLILDEGAYSSAMVPLMYNDPAMQKALAEYQGFAPYAPIMFLSSVPLDPSSMPKDIAGSVLPDASIRLYRLPDYTQVPFVIRYREWEADTGNHYLVSLLPSRPLKQGETYLMVVTEALKSKNGVPLGRAKGFAAIMGEVELSVTDPVKAQLAAAQKARLAPMVEALEDAEHVIGAIDFTVGNEGLETVKIFEMFRKGTNLVIPFNLDADGNGSPDITDGPAFEDCPMPIDQMAYGVHGKFEPLNLTGEDGHFHKDGDEFKSFPQPPVDFWLMVPVGNGPFPVAILGHGINANHHQLCGLSRELVQVGVAVLRFDWPRHGNRGTGALDFLSIGDPPRIRDNFRQAAIDLASACLMIEGLAQTLDKLPMGAPDGKGDLDAQRIGYIGHSLGAIIGMLYYAFSDRIGVMVANEGGLGIYHLAESYLFDMLPPIYEAVGLTNLAEHMLWPGDGISFARHVLEEPLHGEKRRLLVQELIGDQTVSNVSTEALARGVGLTLAEPYHVAVDGLSTAPASELHNALYQFASEDAIHSDFTATPLKPLAKKMHDQAVHYLKSFFEKGEAEIIVP